MALQMGFFADAGPLQIFVSQHLIPSHYRVEITDDAAYESEENAPPIKAGAFVRVRLVGIKAEANQLVSMLSLEVACLSSLSSSPAYALLLRPYCIAIAAVLCSHNQ